MGILFFLTQSVVYFSIMIICMVVSIMTAMVSKYKTSLLWFVIGAVIQLFTLLGGQHRAEILGYSMMAEWITYFVLLIATAIIIVIRYLKKTSSSKK